MTATAQAAASSSSGKKATATKIKAAAAALPPKPPGLVQQLGSMPWLKVGLIAAGAVGAFFLMRGGGDDRPARRNPDDDDDVDDDRDVDDNPRAAMDFYRDFHWGREPRRIRRTSISPTPSELVKLGTLEAVTYSAKKGGEALADYIHHFGETGKKKPILAADPRSKRLHVVGGAYDIESAGIID